MVLAVFHAALSSVDTLGLLSCGGANGSFCLLVGPAFLYLSPSAARWRLAPASDRCSSASAALFLSFDGAPELAAVESTTLRLLVTGTARLVPPEEKSSSAEGRSDCRVGWN